MERLKDLSEYKWIEDETDPLRSSEDQEWQGNSVSSCIPPCYDAYCKIFHVIWEDLSVEDRNISWHQAEADKLLNHLVGVANGGRLIHGVPSESFPSR